MKVTVMDGVFSAFCWLWDVISVHARISRHKAWKILPRDQLGDDALQLLAHTSWETGKALSDQEDSLASFDGYVEDQTI
jgi:hypothetical protein